jgi:hypothetical protein
LMWKWTAGELERRRKGEKKIKGKKAVYDLAPKMSAQVRESTPPVTIYLNPWCQGEGGFALQHRSLRIVSGVRIC